MHKIILIEDIISIANEIKNKLNLFEIKMFTNSHNFLNEYNNTNFKDFLSQTKFFILDFDLGDSTIISSNIYRIILSHKHENSILCCISSYSQKIIEENCKDIAIEFKLKQPFNYYIKKNPNLIKELVESL